MSGCAYFSSVLMAVPFFVPDFDLLRPEDAFVSCDLEEFLGCWPPLLTGMTGATLMGAAYWLPTSWPMRMPAPAAAPGAAAQQHP